MKKLFLAAITSSALILQPIHAYAGGMPVIDVAAIVQLVEQIQRLETMINELNTLTHYADLDHVNLAGGKFRRFLQQYKDLFDGIMDEIDSYQNGGLMGQLDRLDEVYFSYYDKWEDPELREEAQKSDPLYNQLAKQILWTRIQFKHAAKVGAKIRETLPKSQEQIASLLDDTAQAVGVMQSIKIGNQLTGAMAKDIQSLNVSLTEHLQAQSAEGLERNTKEGLKLNRAREAIAGWGERTSSDVPAPKNPFQRF